MKIVNSIFIFISVSAIFGACITPPDISIIPEIHFDKMTLYEKPDKDSLAISITFRDGDGDLGLNKDEDRYNSYPFNKRIYFVDHNGTLEEIQTESHNVNEPSILVIPDDLKCATCKLVTRATKRKPAYQNNNDLPEYYPDNCFEYSYTSIYVLEDDLDFVEGTAVLDTSFHFAKVYSVIDTFYYKVNPNFNNFDVEFLTYQPELDISLKDADGFGLFDWHKEVSCYEDLNGRFPELSIDRGPVEGNLTYGVTARLGFSTILGDQPLKLRIVIRDRQLHRSNVIVTDQFSLKDI